jgi:hypothetical protein
MTKGDILRGRKTNHPIVFLRQINIDQFAACILTHSNNSEFPDNVQLSPDHFLSNDSHGRPFKTQYDNSYFVAIELIKEQDWGPFIKTGRLSQEGIRYIESQIIVLEPLKWAEYILQ